MAFSKRHVIAISFLLPVAAYSTIDDRVIATCAAINGDLERLQCYDQIAISMGLDKSQPLPSKDLEAGNWKITTKRNPIDDTKIVTLTLLSDNAKNRLGDPLYLIARCKSGETDLYIGWRDTINLDPSVVTRIGKQKAENSVWSMSADNNSTFHREPIKLLKSMLSADSFLAQTILFDGSTKTAIFSTSGLNNAIQPLREACRW